MSGSDPLTKLTESEKDFVRHLNATSNRGEVLAELKANLQTAVEIELATIPIYLFSYYSLVRNKTSGENIGPAQLFANKAGGVIMSVAVEEMLHMSLSSNVLYSLGVAPQLYGKAPGPYPTGLPYHNPKGPPGPGGKTAVSIPLAKLSYEQLWHFLQIEYPETPDAWPEDCNWDTIGQYYSYIRSLICTDFITDADFQNGAKARQIQSYNYSPNNVDTVHPSGKFDPWKPAPNSAPSEPAPSWSTADLYPSATEAAVYSNAADSHVGSTQLLSVSSKLEAMQAIDTICDQGEGYAQPGEGAARTDDPSKTEDSHYYKFLTLQAQYPQYANHVEQLAKYPAPPKAVLPTVAPDELVQAKVIVNYPDNPVTANYPAELQPISDFCNGVFQYMLIMTETVYRVPPENQKLFFNEALHRSMIWVLDKFIQTMRGIEICSGPYEGMDLAPTFENIDLGSRRESFAALCALGDQAIAASKGKSYGSSVAYYVAVATTDESDGSPMHLPDVSQYW